MISSKMCNMDHYINFSYVCPLLVIDLPPIPLSNRTTKPSIPLCTKKRGEEKGVLEVKILPSSLIGAYKGCNRMIDYI